MKRLLSLLSLMVAVPLAGHSQGVQPGVYVNRVFTHSDTVQALHDMYRNGRRWGRVLTALAPVAAGFAAYSYPKTDLGISPWGNQPSGPNGHATAYMIAIPATLTFSLVGVLSWNGNSKKIEQETIRHYEMRLPLSQRIQRRLHRQLESTLLTATPQTGS
ncbi:hypothetical protein [Hymenobacter sp. B1770]|uniref:hypothetical protein n=1 Tax=Hymenobacter sp. B1770 TaxID=1718788 RepID=UPI003CE89EBB